MARPGEKHENEAPYWNPPNLYALCLKATVFTFKFAFKDCLNLKNPKQFPHFSFPKLVCNDLVALVVSDFKHLSYSDDLTEILLRFILGSSWCCYSQLHLSMHSQAWLDDPAFAKRIVQHHLTELTIELDTLVGGNAVLPRFSLDAVCKSLRNTLVSLTLKNFTLRRKDLRSGLKHLKKLECLCIPNISIHEGGRKCKHVWPVLPSLEVLDLSGASVTCGNILPVEKHVKILRLYNHIGIEGSLLGFLENLTVLDISATNRYFGSLGRGSELMTVLSKMPSLISLDVSFRTLSVAAVQLFNSPHHRMQFLGLFRSLSFNREDINANEVTGDQTESQILLSLEVYKERAQYVLELLFTLASPVEEFERGLKAIFEVCRVHETDASILLAGTAAIHLYMKHSGINAELKRKAIWILVDIMSRHIEHPDLVQNCCVCLYPYQTMEDSGFVFTKLATALVHIIASFHSLRTLKSALVGLCKMIWWLPRSKKTWLGQAKAVEVILDVIMRLKSVDPQDNPLPMVEIGWNILWNITDGCPENCMLFCACGGIEVMLACCETHQEVLESSMSSIFGALANVVEVEELQSKVMSQKVITSLRPQKCKSGAWMRKLQLNINL